jgi:hypothetical protein
MAGEERKYSGSAVQKDLFERFVGRSEQFAGSLETRHNI